MSAALLFWENRPYVSSDVQKYIDTVVNAWLENPELSDVTVEVCLRKNLEARCIDRFEKIGDPMLSDEDFIELASVVEMDSNLYLLIKEGLMEGYETDEGELMVWWTDLGKKAAAEMDLEDNLNETESEN